MKCVIWNLIHIYSLLEWRRKLRRISQRLAKHDLSYALDSICDGNEMINSSCGTPLTEHLYVFWKIDMQWIEMTSTEASKIGASPYHNDPIIRTLYGYVYTLNYLLIYILFIFHELLQIMKIGSATRISAFSLYLFFAIEVSLRIFCKKRRFPKIYKIAQLLIHPMKNIQLQMRVS